MTQRREGAQPATAAAIVEQRAMEAEAGGGQLRRPNSQAFSSSGRGAMTQCRGAPPAAWYVNCEDCGGCRRRGGDREGRGSGC
jgi:hypothetical protein